MKKIVFPFLLILMFGLSGCIKPGNNISSYNYLPAIVDFIDWTQPVLSTPIGPVTSQEFINKLNNYELGYGDALLTSFKINTDLQTSSKYWIASEFQCVVVDKNRPQETPGGESMAGDFDLPVESMGLYGWVDDWWFFGCEHKNVSNDDRFLYEMTYDSETVGTPVLIVRAKKSDEGFYPACAFYMYDFFSDIKSGDNTVKFKIKYKTGVNEDGTDKCEFFKDNYGNETIIIPFE